MIWQYKRVVYLIILSLILTRCTGGGCSARKIIEPEVQLHRYIEKAVNITKPSEREELVGLTAGPLKERLVAMSDKAFKEAYIDKRYDFRAFEVVEKKELSDKEVQIDFSLQYKSWRSGEWQERSPMVMTTNRVYMVFEYGQWAIARVENLGSSFEWEIGLPLDNVSPASSPAEPTEEAPESSEPESGSSTPVPE